MAKKYNFSATRQNKITNLIETIQIVDCDSFDEARREVERAINDRDLEEKRLMTPKDTGLEGQVHQSLPAVVADPVPTGDAKPHYGTVPSGNNTQGSG